ncbi:hypothetical protein AC1031_001874 [Aphanomyces cochlioides]|nr:hypothetical protein AC1031_001874 [Aphanomyces cochlioides]
MTIQKNQQASSTNSTSTATTDSSNVHHSTSRSSTRRKSTTAPGPKRHIRIILEKATDLPVSDSALAGGSSDPYVVFSFGKDQVQSSVVDKSLNPTWPNDEFELIVTEADLFQHKHFQVKVMDYNTSGMHTLMAHTTLDLAAWTGATTLKSARLQSHPLTMAPSLAEQAVKPVLTMSVAVVSEAEAATDLMLEVWENERWVPGGGWHKSHLTRVLFDPPAWTNEDNGRGGAHFNDAVAVPRGYKPTTEWEFKVVQGDTNGWMYAGTFLGPWHIRQAMTSVVRRRLWERHYTIEQSVAKSVADERHEY